MLQYCLVLNVGNVCLCEGCNITAKYLANDGHKKILETLV